MGTKMGACRSCYCAKWNLRIGLVKEEQIWLFVSSGHVGQHRGGGGHGHHGAAGPHHRQLQGARHTYLHNVHRAQFALHNTIFQILTAAPGPEKTFEPLQQKVGLLISNINSKKKCLFFAFSETCIFLKPYWWCVTVYLGGQHHHVHRPWVHTVSGVRGLVIYVLFWTMCHVPKLIWSCYEVKCVERPGCFIPWDLAGLYRHPHGASSLPMRSDYRGHITPSRSHMYTSNPIYIFLGGDFYYFVEGNYCINFIQLVHRALVQCTVRTPIDCRLKCRFLLLYQFWNWLETGTVGG